MDSRDSASEQDGRHTRPLLLALLLLAAVVRLWSLDFGLPHTLARPDETEIVTRSLRFFAWDLNPRFFHYPSLFFYLIAAVYAVWAGALALFGQPLTETLAAAALDLSPYLLMARTVSALAGVATVGALYTLGRAFAGVRVGLAAGLFLAVAPLHVRDSHFATTDVVLTLFVVLATLFVLRSYRTGRWQDYALAGICSGLAMSVKYVGLLMPCAITVAYVLSLDTTVLTTPLQRARWVVRDARPWIFTAFWLGAFLVTSPYAVLDNALFLRHFLFQLDHLADGHGLDLGIGGVYHLRYTLPLGVGWPVFIAAIIGAPLAFRERWREALVVLAFPVVFYVSTFTSQTLFLRYMMPVIPFLCLLAGFTVTRIGEWLAGSESDLVGPRGAPESWKRLPVLPALAIALAALPLWRDVTTNRLLGRTDSRVLAAAWLAESAGAGTHTVFQTGEEWGHLQLPRSPAYYDAVLEGIRLPAITPARQVGRDYERFQARVRREDALDRRVTFESVDTTEVEAGARPDFIVVPESDLARYSAVPSWVRDVLAEEYEPVHRIPGASGSVDGRPGAGAVGWYDQTDAFYLPFTGFADVERPGPLVRIYRRTDAPR